MTPMMHTPLNLVILFHILCKLNRGKHVHENELKITNSEDM